MAIRGAYVHVLYLALVLCLCGSNAPTLVVRYFRDLVLWKEYNWMCKL